MKTADEKLIAFFETRSAPERDPAFRIALMALQEERRMRRRMAVVAALGLVACAIILAVGPALAVFLNTHLTAASVAAGSIGLIAVALAFRRRTGLA
jgi:hypothetical protein